MATPPVQGDSTKATEAGVKGTNTAVDGHGVHGESADGVGVWGFSNTRVAVVGESRDAEGIRGIGHKGAGVSGTSDAWLGVYGESQHADGVCGIGHKGAGVSGKSDAWLGVYGESQQAEGVRGLGHKGAGVSGTSDLWHGVFGETQGAPGAAGVYGSHRVAGTGVVGVSQSGAGMWGASTSGEGVHGETHSQTVAAIAGLNLNPTGTGAAIYGKKVGSAGHAGFFEGNVCVTGDITLLGADCAEEFDVNATDLIAPGTVVVFDDNGFVRPSDRAYDKRVVGVVCGAGDYRPGIVLDKRRHPGNRQPIGLMGKVFCKVDARYGAIEVGDLLTTSPTIGHAMKANDPTKAFGAIIGKALRSLPVDQGEIPILIALH